METKCLNAQGKEFELSQNSFEFVQKDKKIFDKKFDTKPTTFVKDAFKRFCKNKSSVVAAIIIGIIIILAIIQPIMSPYDIENPHPKETMLEPKLFNVKEDKNGQKGNHFWDGTKEFYGQPYDINNECPYGFETRYCYNIETYVDEEGKTKCNFTYDIYEKTYGVQQMNVASVYFDRYIDNGWFTWDGTNPESLQILDEVHCPIVKIVEVKSSSIIVCDVCMYKYLGYEKMPSYLFGTDSLGRDLTKRVFMGLRYSLVFSTSIALICFSFGLCWGSISGYFGGNVDLIMERFTDILGGIPTICIVTMFKLHYGDKLWVFAFALCLTGWMGTAAGARTQFYRFKGREYVLASRTLGSGDARLIFKHILPNALGTIVTSAVMMIPGLIFTEASLSYLGLGLKGSNSFGNILSDNQAFLQTHPWLILFPSIIISLLEISFNLFGNGLRDALNPSLKGSD